MSCVHCYRSTMARYLDEARQMIGHLLSEADFGEAFPHLFGIPDDDPPVALRNASGLLLRKADLHISTVLKANEHHNVHSMAVHMRVVLECAAQVIADAHAHSEGSRGSYTRLLNATESDYLYAMRAASRGQIDHSTLQEGIARARTAIGEPLRESPKRVTVTDRITSLPGGTGWYDYISEFFCSPNVDVLTGPRWRGGVVSTEASEVDLACAGMLRYLAWVVMDMLLAHGFLLIVINEDQQPFEDAVALKKRWLAEEESARPAGWTAQQAT